MHTSDTKNTTKNCFTKNEWEQKKRAGKNFEKSETFFYCCYMDTLNVPTRRYNILAKAKKA